MILKGVGQKLYDYFLRPRPTLFDIIAIYGIGGVGLVPRPIMGFYLCGFAWVLWMVGFSYPNERNECFPSLTIFCLMAFSSMFIHTFYYCVNSITFQYLNFYLLFEGWVYPFCGCAIFVLLVNKGRNLRLMWVTLPLALIPGIEYAIKGGRGSAIFALGIASLAYFFSKNKKVGFLILFLLASFFLINKDWFMKKWDCRVPLWYDMTFQKPENPVGIQDVLLQKPFEQYTHGVINHPLLGHGYNKLILRDNFFLSTSWGETGLYRQNDYINIAHAMGALIWIPLGMFMWRIFTQVKGSWFLIPCLTIAILSFVQLTMFWGSNALFVVCMLALVYGESLKKKELIWT